MNNKVAILGKLPTKHNAPFNNTDWDIWAFNYHNDILPRVTKWFDIHANGANPNADITRASFPFKAVEELVGGQYFNNSVRYLIAYAILKSKVGKLFANFKQFEQNMSNVDVGG